MDREPVIPAKQINYSVPKCLVAAPFFITEQEARHVSALAERMGVHRYNNDNPALMQGQLDENNILREILLSLREGRNPNLIILKVRDNLKPPVDVDSVDMFPKYEYGVGVCGFVGYRPVQNGIPGVLELQAHGIEYISNMYIHPDYQGKGLASILKEAMYKELRSRGVSVIGNWVNDYNLNSKKLQVKEGYEQIMIKDFCIFNHEKKDYDRCEPFVLYRKSIVERKPKRNRRSASAVVSAG